MSKLPATRDRVHTYLSAMQLNGVEMTPEGGWTFRVESTRVFISTAEQAAQGGDTRTLVNISAPVVMDARLSPDLYEYVALHADDYLFGHLHVAPTESGQGHLLMSHTLLGDHLDEPEFRDALVGLAGTAETLDDQLAPRFGGHRIHEG
jgi:hypothetical protein